MHRSYFFHFNINAQDGQLFAGVFCVVCHRRLDDISEKGEEMAKGRLPPLYLGSLCTQGILQTNYVIITIKEVNCNLVKKNSAVW